MPGIVTVRVALLAVVLTLLPAVLPYASAQALRLSASGGTSPELRVGVSSVPRGADEVDAVLVVSSDPGAELRVRRAEAFGPLGTLVFEADASARFGSDPAGRFAVAARGVLGPVAAALRAAAWGAPPERFVETAATGRAPFHRGASLRVSGEGRLDRTWLLAAGATGWRGAGDGGDRANGGESALDLDATLRGRRAAGPDLDLTVTAQGRLAGRAGGRAALGAGVVLAPRRAPEIAANVWLDVRPTADGVRVVPGISSEGVLALGDDRLAWSATARPGGLERSPWSLDANWRRPAWDGTVEVHGGVRAGGQPGAAWSVGIAYRSDLGGTAWRRDR